MREPTLRTSRLAIAGGLIAAIATSGAGFVLGRLSSPRPAPPAVVQPVPARPIVEAPRILGRADIIALGNRAAADHAAGAPLSADISAMIGQRVELALPFGCAGPAAEENDAPTRWRYDESEQTLRIRVTPIRWGVSDWGLAKPVGPLVPAAGPESGLTGFWVERPWATSERCPVRRDDETLAPASPVEASRPTLAVARTIADDQRSGDRPYELVQRIAPDRIQAAAGFRLRLSGRIERLADGSPMRCTQAGGIDQRPRCLIGISFDQVRIENALDDTILATWTAPPASRETAP